MRLPWVRGGGRESVVRIGDPAPEFVLTSSTGDEVMLAGYRGRANVAILFVREFT